MAPSATQTAAPPATTVAAAPVPVPQTPPVAPPPATPIPQTPKKKHGCLGCCLALGVLFILACLGVGGIALAYKAGYINVFQIKNAFGVGYGEASVMDMLDTPIDAQITALDTDPSTLLTTQLNLKKYEISSFRALEPGRYTIEFTDTAGVSLGSCTLAAKSGDEYQFVAVPSGIAVTRKGYDPTTAQELNILTSSLCQN